MDAEYEESAHSAITISSSRNSKYFNERDDNLETTNSLHSPSSSNKYLTGTEIANNGSHRQWFLKHASNDFRSDENIDDFSEITETNLAYKKSSKGVPDDVQLGKRKYRQCRRDYDDEKSLVESRHQGLASRPKMSKCKKISLEDVTKLRESSRKLYHLVETIQAKTRSRNIEVMSLTADLRALPVTLGHDKEFFKFIGGQSLQQLEKQAKTMDGIQLEGEMHHCSPYKRLIRKCTCMNRIEYNDFVIHFNESTKYYTTHTGEIIKNMHILKKFLYMNGVYARNALMFLNEGLLEASRTEKMEIINGCSHADICNVFDTDTIVLIYISWPCKYDSVGDAEIQNLTASFLFKLSQVEEGRRYLNYSSRITSDMNKVLKKKSTYLDFETIEAMNGTLTSLQKSVSEHGNIHYFCKAPEKGMIGSILQVIMLNREYMTYEELMVHLNLVQNMSTRDGTKTEFAINLPIILAMTKHLLVEYDDSDMNITLINILKNILSEIMEKNTVVEQSDYMHTITTDTSTEPTVMKSETEQWPPRKNIDFKRGKTQRFTFPMKNKAGQGKNINSVIVVPVEKKSN